MRRDPDQQVGAWRSVAGDLINGLVSGKMNQENQETPRILLGKNPGKPWFPVDFPFNPGILPILILFSQ